MDLLSRVGFVLVLLVVATNATKYRAFRIMANEEVTLPCWELENPNDLIVWITPQEKIIGINYQDDSNKYKINMEGALIVNVSGNFKIYYCFGFLNFCFELKGYN